MAATISTRRPAKGHASIGTRTVRRWSQDVTKHSNALDLEPHLFASDSPEEIAASLKRSALSSRRRKDTAFQSAMSMLSFYINRAGRRLPKERRATLEQAKGKLRESFGRPP